MKALVLAAGKGVRMMPLTIDKPKVLIQISGKPFLSYVLENLKKAGFSESDIFIVVSHHKEQVIKWLDENGISANIIDQGKPQGTGHAVLQAERWIKENFVVAMGDNLYSAADMEHMAVEDELFYVGAFESTHPRDYGVIETKAGKLVKIEEKPANPKSSLVNTGLYKFTPEIFSVLKKLQKSPRGEYELTDAINILAAEGKVRAVKLHDYWIDMSSAEQLPKIEKQINSLF